MLRTVATMAVRGLETSRMVCTRHPVAGNMMTRRGLALFAPQKRSLNQIMEVPLLMPMGTQRIIAIWNEYNIAHPDFVAATLPAEKFNKFQERANLCKFFVLPLKKEQGFLNLFLQHDDKECIVTSLDEYRRFGAHAPVYLQLNHYDELKDLKDLVLMRGKVNLEKMTKMEAQAMAMYLHLFYLSDERYNKFVRPFNENPRDFHFDALLQELSHLGEKRGEEHKVKTEEEIIKKERQKLDGVKLKDIDANF